MERTLLWSAMAIGLVGWLCSLLAARRGALGDESERIALPYSYRIMAISIPLLVFAGTAPSRPPFAPGQAMGRGFLLGAAAALAAGWAIRRAAGIRTNSTTPDYGRTAAAIGPLFLGCAVVTAALMWLHTEPMDALLGAGIGWFVEATLLAYGWMGQGRAGRASALAMTMSVGYMITLVSVCALGQMRSPVRFGAASMPVSWSAIGLSFGAMIPFLALLGALPTALFARAAGYVPGALALGRLADPLTRGEEERDFAALLGRLILGALLLALAASMFGSRIEGHPPFLALTFIGLAAGLLIWQIGVRSVSSQPVNAAGSRQMAFFSALVVLAAVMAAHQMLAGYGVALMLLGAWLPAAYLVGGIFAGPFPAQETTIRFECAGRLLALLLFGGVLTLYRVYTARYRHELSGVELTDHYALFGFLLGAMIPALLANFAAHGLWLEDRQYKPRMGRLLLVGLLALAVPAVTLVLFGAKCALALFFGLALAAALGATGSDRGADSEGDTVADPLLPALFALAMALALTQWTHHILPLALYARAAKARAILSIIGATVALMLASDYGERLHARRRASIRPDAPVGTKGAGR